MTAGDADLVARLPGWAFAFVLVLARCGSACMLIPGSGEAEVPMTVRAGFALALTALLLPVLADALPGVPDAPWRAFGMIGAEIISGLFLGWLARLAIMALTMAGQIIAIVSGQASVLQPDVLLGTQATALGRLFGLAAPVVVLITDLHTLPLLGLAGSYRAIPAGTLLPAGDTTASIVTALVQIFACALRLATPFVLAGIVWHATLALVSRLVPHVHVFFLAAPAQLLGGLLLLALLAATLLQVWRDQAAAALAALPGL